MNEFKLLPKIFNWQKASEKIAETVQRIVPAANIYITTSKGENYIQLGKIDGSVLTNIQFHLANPGKQTLGDKLYIISQPDTTSNDIEYCYDDSYFYITRCGGKESPPCSTFDGGEQERDVTIFTYDGEKFCSTYDNC